MSVKVVHLLLAVTRLIHRPVGVRMCDMLKSELENQSETLSRWENCMCEMC